MKGGKEQVKLSDPSNARAVFAIMEEEGAADYVYQSYHDLIEGLGFGVASRETFLWLWRRATRAVERGRAPKAARDSYAEIAEVVRRVKAGESIREISAEREKKSDAAIAEHRRRELARPEPKNKLSDAWRYWKLRQWEHAWSQPLSADGRRAWEEFRALWFALSDDPNFWHVDNARVIAAHLIIARQEIDRMKRDQTRPAGKRKEARRDGQ